MVEDQVQFDFCQKVQNCGHACKGVAGEAECLPCFVKECLEISDGDNMAELQPQDMMEMSPE